MKIYTKESLIDELIKTRNLGWIENRRHGNHGGIGNTLEDLLGIEENNLPIPNAAEWELKCQSQKTQSLITLFHLEPSPRSLKLVTQLLLPYYGWKHQEAGKKYPDDCKSFRQTINAIERTDRVFGIKVDYEHRKISVSFDAKKVSNKHQEWLENVNNLVGLNELETEPYWGFDDLFHKAGLKLGNCFFVMAKEKREKNKLFFLYDKIYMLQKFSLDNFIKAIETGKVLIDFDARTGHNHGTKFRVRQSIITELYEHCEEI
jgi:hypothetical protein